MHRAGESNHHLHCPHGWWDVRRSYVIVVAVCLAVADSALELGFACVGRTGERRPGNQLASGILRTGRWWNTYYDDDFFPSSLFPSLYFPRYDRCDSGIHGLLEVAHIKESNNYVQKRRGKSDDKFMNSSRQQMDCPRAANRVTLSLQIAYTGRTRQAIYLLLLIQMHLVDLQTSMNSDFDRFQKSILRITMGYETVVHISLSRPTNSW